MRPAFRLHHGSSQPSTTNLTGARISVVVHESRIDEATDYLVTASNRDLPRARELFFVAHDRLKWARLRLRRAELQASGLRWLEVVKP